MLAVTQNDVKKPNIITAVSLKTKYVYSYNYYTDPPLQENSNTTHTFVVMSHYTGRWKIFMITRTLSNNNRASTKHHAGIY